RRTSSAPTVTCIGKVHREAKPFPRESSRTGSDSDFTSFGQCARWVASTREISVSLIVTEPTLLIALWLGVCHLVPPVGDEVAVGVQLARKGAPHRHVRGRPIGLLSTWMFSATMSTSNFVHTVVPRREIDRKSTRLNSSHVSNS